MKMRRAIVAFLAVICIFALVCTFGVFAEGTNRVYAETNTSAGQGEYGYCYIYLDDLTDLASLNVAVHYDTDKVTVIDSYNQVACSLYDFSNNDGCLQYSYIFNGEGSSEKTNLFYFYYQIDENAEIGSTYFDIVVSDAYNSSLEPVSISGSRYNFTITEKKVAKTAYVYGSTDVETSVREEFEINYYLSDWEIASGAMAISYDPELFEFVEITNGEFLNNKVVDVNTSLDGSVYLSFLSTEYSYNTELLKVKFRTLKNVTETSEIKLAVSELYDLELNRIVCNGYSTNVAITHDASYTEDSPSMSLSASYNSQTDKVILTVLLEKNSQLGAGDFVLSFDTTYLTYSSAQKGFSPSFFNINDKNVGDGILKFSIISLSNITDEQTVLTVEFDVKHACEDKLIDFEISGSGLADSLTNPIILNFVDASVTVPLKHTDGNDNNHLCDNGCGQIADDGCYDNDTNHVCDECSATGLGEHTDGDDNNHLCDYGCGQVADGGCHDVNTDADHKCDECGADNVTAHIDGNDNNHLCDNGCGQIADDGCYDNDTNHACDECGKADMGTHADSATDNDHVCDYGCGITLENCSGGRATCQAKAICSICNMAYGSLGDHDYDTTKCVSVGENGHAYKCKLCSAYTDETDHFSEDAESCTADKLCDACGYKMAEALGHSYTERTDNIVRTAARTCQEHNTYWYDCSRCGISAKNDAGATDKWYTSTEAGAHVMSSDWSSMDNQHFHQCTLCEHTDEKIDCAGGTATCQVKASCSTCGDAYGNFADHSYDTSRFGYQGDDGHAHKCLYCEAHDTVEPHSPNVDEATEDIAKYCTVSGCGYIIEQQLNHTHAEGAEWERNSTHHWHDCVANDGQEFSKAEHTYDNDCDATCNGGCGYVRIITHDYTKLEKSVSEHWYVCRVCGEEKVNSRASHSGGTSTCQAKAICYTCGQAYGNLGDHDYDTTKWVSVDENSHAHKCKLCDEVSDNTSHASSSNATCTEAKTCDACGHEMEVARGHSYTKRIESPAYLKAEGVDCQSHHTYYYICVHCDVSSKNDTGISYEGSAVGPHNMLASWTTEYAEETNAGYHYHACTVEGCDYKEDEGECTGGARTCIALAICSTCQKAYGEYAEHSYGSAWDYKDENGHAHVCKVMGCGAHDEIQPHTPDIPAPTEEQAQLCTACGYQMAAQLNHTHNVESGWTSSATHHWHACSGCDVRLDEAQHSYADNCDTTCETCGYERSVMHDFDGAWHKDASGHWHVCATDGCGAIDVKGEHVSAGAATETNPERCSICGWEISPALGHQHSAESEWQKNDTYHWHACSGCNEHIDEAEHIYSNDCDTTCDCGYVRTVIHNFTGEWQKNDTHHWHACSGCEEEIDKSAHNYGEWTITTSATQNEAGEKERVCADCGHKQTETIPAVGGGTTPPHTHSYGSIWVIDANEHWNECACGNKANRAAHVDFDSNGKCDTCDYQMNTATPKPDSDPKPPVDGSEGSKDRLGTGAIVGIIVGSVLVVSVGGFALFWFVIKKKTLAEFLTIIKNK